jgi:hypothetical protein
MKKANTIFVQMASYRDPELIPSLNDMINQADHPENLHICICWQHGDEETVELFLDNKFEANGFSKYKSNVKEFDIVELTKEGASIRLIDVHFNDTEGACWARYQIQQQYKNEKYTFQLDSHHRFVPQWDTLVIEMLESLRKESPKPLLTAYIPSFDPEHDPEARIHSPWKMDFDRFIPEGAVFFRPSTIDDFKERDKPMRSRWYSAHFCFVDGKFAKEVPHDPNYFFHGEEISIAARAYTHGYDLYHPHRVIAWHEYTRKGRTKIWDDHTTPVKNEGKITLDWVQRNDMCHRRNRILFAMDGEDPNQIDFGPFGFGTERTLREYEEYAGISFNLRGIQQSVLDRLEPPVYLPYETEEQWKATITHSNDVHVCLHKSEFSEIVDDFDFFFVGCHALENGTEVEIYRKDLVKEQIYEYFNSPNGFVDYRLIFLSVKKPVSFTVWAHSTSRGWMDKITKKLNY